MTAVAATSALEMAPAPVRNDSGKARQGQSPAHGAKDATNAKGAKAIGSEKNGTSADRAEKAQKSDCSGATACGFEDEGGTSFDDTIDVLGDAADKQLEQKAAITLPPVVAQGVASAKFEDASGKADATALAGGKGQGPARARGDWLGMGVASETAVESVSLAAGANVPSEALSATVFDRVRGLKLDELTGIGDRGSNVELAEATSEPRAARVNVVSQEAHWNFSSSPQRISSRTAETLAVAGPALTQARLHVQATAAGDVNSPVGKDADFARNATATASIQPATRAGTTAGEGGAGQMDSGTNRQASGSATTDLVQQLRRSASVKSEGTTAVSQAGFATDAVKSPAQQVADAIVDAAPPSEAVATGAATSAPNNVLRRLDIKLDPANLGEVQVKLSLNANALTISISAANTETAKMLSQDRQHIDAGLRRAGYDLVDYTVAVATNDATAASITATSPTGDARPSSSQNSGGSPSQLPNGSGGLNERGAGRNDFGQQPRQQAAERIPRDASAAAAVQGGIYV